jgi:hypothetical protein
LDSTTGSILAVILIGAVIGVFEYLRRRAENRTRR